MLDIRAECKNPDCRSTARVQTTSSGPAELRCTRCSTARPTEIDPALATEGRLEECPLCTGREFFVRKDFPQKLGLAVVISAGLLSCIFFYQKQMLWVWAVLGGAVLIDAALYFVTGIVVVCYRCRAEFRGLPYNPAVKPFDLATSEKYGEVE